MDRSAEQRTKLSVHSRSNAKCSFRLYARKVVALLMVVWIRECLQALTRDNDRLKPICYKAFKTTIYILYKAFFNGHSVQKASLVFHFHSKCTLISVLFRSANAFPVEVIRKHVCTTRKFRSSALLHSAQWSRKRFRQCSVN